MTVANQIQVMQDLHATITGITTAKGARVVTWEASQKYVIGRTVKPTTANNFYYEATTSGQAGASEPTWPTVLGNTVVDSAVTWQAIADTDDLGLPEAKLSSADFPLVITEPREANWQKLGGLSKQDRMLEVTVFLREYNEKLHALAHADAVLYLQRFGAVYTDPDNAFQVIDMRINSELVEGLADSGLGMIEYLSDKFYGIQFQIPITDTEGRI